MKYTLTLDLAAANIVAVLTDENDNQTTTRYAYAGVEFPSDPVSPDNIVTTLLDTLTTINNGLPGDTDVLTEVHFVSGIANGWIALDADFNALTEVISGGDNRAAKYVQASKRFSSDSAWVLHLPRGTVTGQQGIAPSAKRQPWAHHFPG